MVVPLLGIPVLNRGDLLARCLDSIDYPVERIVIINNGTDETVEASIARAAKIHANLEAIRPPSNLGVAASWNYFLRHYDAAFHVVCGSDIQFAPGDIEKIATFVTRRPHHAIVFGNHGYSLFALTRLGLDLVGYFDENFYPAYLEDCDHFYRVTLLHGHSADVPGLAALHGEAPHWGSSTILSDPVLRRWNAITHTNNFTYYRAKWGGLNGEETYIHPFNDPSRSPRDWILDHDFRQAALASQLVVGPYVQAI